MTCIDERSSLRIFLQSVFSQLVQHFKSRHSNSICVLWVFGWRTVCPSIVVSPSNVGLFGTSSLIILVLEVFCREDCDCMFRDFFEAVKIGSGEGEKRWDEQIRIFLGTMMAPFERWRRPRRTEWTHFAAAWFLAFLIQLTDRLKNQEYKERRDEKRSVRLPSFEVLPSLLFYS